MEQAPPPLKRSLGLTLTLLYGLGTILGAGIYVLVGEVAGIAGMNAPLAFLVALLLAGMTALSYTELSSRFPQSAGEAIYLQKGFNVRWLTVIVGLLISFAGITSSATLLQGFAGYFQQLIHIPSYAVIIFMCLSLGLLAVWGIKESVSFAAIITIVEIIGLLIIIWTGHHHLFSAHDNLIQIPQTATAWKGIFIAGFVAFYAFIGFEDMVNVAEEVKNPKRTLPLAIILALVIATVLYMLISIISISSVTPEQLSHSKAPLALVYATNTHKTSFFITIIGMFAVINGALVQMIMASRVLYGMAKQKWIPSLFSQVHKKRKTPVVATVLVVIITMSLSIWFPLLSLAKATSFFTLCVFTLVNFALYRIKSKDPTPVDVWTVPIIIPLLGAFFNIGLLLISIFDQFGVL